MISIFKKMKKIDHQTNHSDCSLFLMTDSYFHPSWHAHSFKLLPHLFSHYMFSFNLHLLSPWSNMLFFKQLNPFFKTALFFIIFTYFLFALTQPPFHAVIFCTAVWMLIFFNFVVDIWLLWKFHCFQFLLQYPLLEQVFSF